MKNTLYLVIGIVLIIIIGFYLSNRTKDNTPQVTEKVFPGKIIPIEHATAVIEWNDMVFYVDPTGGAEAYVGQKTPNVILVTDIHGDHLSTSTLSAIKGGAVIIAPKAVYDLLSPELKTNTKVLSNLESVRVSNYEITAEPMYNLPEATTSRHTKGRGNGYIISNNDFRVYIAGDTSGTPEMRGFSNIDIAFIPMNPPFTMTVEEAANAVLAFKPKTVYPYHYRSPDGLNDINRFKELVNSVDPSIKVVLENWYPNN